MKSAVIIGAGDFPRKDYPLYLAESADYVVVCDGAIRSWARRFPLRRPDAVTGDMDSISPALRRRFGDVLVQEDEQETNDQSKALRLTLERFKDIDCIHILGATGRREDHTIGNLSLLMEYARQYGLSAESSPSLDMVSDWSTAFAVTGSTTLAVGEGRSISIFSPDNSLNIKSEGLVWPTDSVVFDNWWKATLNRSSAPLVSLTFSHPSLALVILS
ncbi:MAG: thiamine diphosphokinase [Bacteroidales bacterium]|nr:thiamine diphosphokinase [Bacteroidales bacterium]